MELKDIVDILVRRDGVSKREAWDTVDECKKEIDWLVMNGGSLQEMEDSIAYWLGLEPDYLDALLVV